MKDKLKKMGELKKNEEETRRLISELQINIEKQKQINMDELPKLDLDRDTEKKKEREDYEVLMRNFEAEKSRRDEEKIGYETFIKKRDEYEAQVKLQGEQLSKYRLENQRELQDFQRNEKSLIEYQTLTFKQAQKIKELKVETDQLNERFPQEVARYTKDIEFMKFDNENRRSELQYKYENLSDTLRIRHKESKKIRQYLQLILDQRSELEHFFIDEIQKTLLKKDNKYHKNNKVDMSWEERQDIIEKVIGQINGGVLPIYWREIDVEELKRTIIKEEEKRVHRMTGVIPDDSDVQNTIDNAINED